MARRSKKPRAAEAARAFPAAPKSGMRVDVIVRKTGRKMNMTIAEARALAAVGVVDYKAPESAQERTYQRRDIVAERPYFYRTKSDDE